MSPRPVLPQVALRLLYPALLAGAFWVLLRGHNEPGGGFIGGLIAVAAVAAWASVYGVEGARRRLPLAPGRLAAVGVGLSLASGLPAVLLGRPFLTHLWGGLPLGPAELKLSTVMVFDLGVFCTVWGALSGFVFGLLAEGARAREGAG